MSMWHALVAGGQPGKQRAERRGSIVQIGQSVELAIGSESPAETFTAWRARTSICGLQANY
jgi:hypothetical protein